MDLADMDGAGRKGRLRDAFARILAEREALLLAAVWLLAWLLPWPAWLEALPWVRLGLAILLFAVPGMAASLMLAGSRFTLPAHFSTGLGISIFLVGLLGFLGRIFHWPFALIHPVFVIAGLAGILAAAYLRRSGATLYRPARMGPVTWALLALMTALGSLVALQHRFGIDDFSYLAYLTNWQHAGQLNFREVFFGTQGLDHIRFWMAMFPMSLAFLAEISRLPGLLLFGLYLEPLLVFAALLAIYNLYEDLLHSERLAVTALLLHFTFLFMRPVLFITGTVFFNRLSHDKAFAALLLAPMFFVAVRYFLEAYSRRSGLLVLILGMALVLTHPVILAFSVFIAGVYAAVVLLGRRQVRRLAVMLVLLAAIILPSASQRLLAIPRIGQRLLGVDSPLLRTPTFDLDSALDTNNIDTRISYIAGTPFYGFNLSTFSIKMPIAAGSPLAVFLSRIPLWILGLGFLWSLLHLKHEAAPLIAASSLLVILCAVPYTGWLVGFFVSARQLARSTWLLPMGLIIVLLLAGLIGWIHGRMGREAAAGIGPMAQAGIWAVCFLLLGYYSLSIYGQKWESSGSLRSYRQNLEALAGLGGWLEQALDEPARFAARPEMRDYLPGLSSKSKVVFFRQENMTPWRVDSGLLNALSGANPAVTVDRRVRIMKKYQIQYILVRSARVGSLYSSHADLFEVMQAGDFWLVRLRQPVGPLEPVR